MEDELKNAKEASGILYKERSSMKLPTDNGNLKTPKTQAPKRQEKRMQTISLNARATRG